MTASRARHELPAGCRLVQRLDRQHPRRPHALPTPVRAGDAASVFTEIELYTNAYGSQVAATAVNQWPGPVRTNG